MSVQHGNQLRPDELFCRETQTLVEENRMRPGYDCRCSGCLTWVAAKGDPMKKAK